MYISIIEKSSGCDQCRAADRRLGVMTYADCSYGANGTPILFICTRCMRPTFEQWYEFLEKKLVQKFRSIRRMFL